MIGTVAVRQRTAPQQLAHAFRPPALRGFGLAQQIRDRPLAPDEHQRLAHQLGFEHIAVALEAAAGEVRVTEEGQRLQHPTDGTGARQWARGGGHHNVQSPWALITTASPTDTVVIAAVDGDGVVGVERKRVLDSVWPSFSLRSRPAEERAEGGAP